MHRQSGGILNLKRKSLVMVFGVFDGLHKGHLNFLKEASAHGNVIVVVARDSAAAELKNHRPLLPENERLSAVKKLPMVFKAVLGDKTRGSYGVIKTHKPDVICLGYDQKGLKNDIYGKIWKGFLPKIKLMFMSPYRPKELHSSLLRRKSKELVEENLKK